jgi:hypothetical protein
MVLVLSSVAVRCPLLFKLSGVKACASFRPRAVHCIGNFNANAFAAVSRKITQLATEYCGRSRMSHGDEEVITCSITYVRHVVGITVHISRLSEIMHTWCLPCSMQTLMHSRAP